MCSCVEHIINTVTQAVILSYSKSKFYEPTDKDEDTSFITTRDEIGIIRAIAVKVLIILLLYILREGLSTDTTLTGAYFSKA